MGDGTSSSCKLADEQLALSILHLHHREEEGRCQEQEEEKRSFDSKIQARSYEGINMVVSGFDDFNKIDKPKTSQFTSSPKIAVTP